MRIIKGREYDTAECVITFRATHADLKVLDFAADYAGVTRATFMRLLLTKLAPVDEVGRSAYVCRLTGEVYDRPT
jgi:hypothetical protein